MSMNVVMSVISIIVLENEVLLIVMSLYVDIMFNKKKDWNSIFL